MKNYVYIMLLCSAGLLACGKYTDISPKGKNLLNRVSDLDLLMNAEFSGNRFNMMNQSILINDMYPQAQNVPNIINGPARDLNYMFLTYDNSIDRVNLTASDGPYQGMYDLISNVANIVLQNADEATGDRNLARQLKAEAYVMRAYLHYLLVNIYAKSYDPATAAADGGIPYVDDIDFETVNPKLTVQEVYHKMNSDMDAAFALDALTEAPRNNMRFGKAFALAVKARIRLSMRDYPGALAAANEALAIKSELEDHRPFLSPGAGGGSQPVLRDGLTANDNLFYAYFGKQYPVTFSPSLEILADYYEPGNILKDSTTAYNFMYGELLSGLSGVPMFFASGYQQNAAGMTTSDLYLIAAECQIRTGKYAEGMDLVNKIRQLRVYPYQPLAAATEAIAMKHFQRTARIEFLFTWRNFVDLKRWNAEGAYPVAVKRTIHGKSYELPANSPLWNFAFPRNATDFNPTLTQNF